MYNYIYKNFFKLCGFLFIAPIIATPINRPYGENEFDLFPEVLDKFLVDGQFQSFQPTQF